MATLSSPMSPRSNKKIDSTLLLNCQYLDNNGQAQDISPQFWTRQLEQQLQKLQSSVVSVQGQELQAEDTSLEQIAWEAFYNFLALVYSKTWPEKKQANLKALRTFQKVKSMNKSTEFRKVFSSPSFISKDYLVSTYCSTYLHQRPTHNSKILSMYSYLLSESEALLYAQKQAPFPLENFIAIVYQQQALIASEELQTNNQTFHIDFFAVKQSFEKSIQFDKLFAIFHCNASQFLWKYNFTDEALVMINQAIAIDSSDESFFISRGCIRFHNKEWRHATRKDFETAIQLNPNCATAHCNLGTSLELLFGEAAKALECYIKSYQLDPENQTINLVYIARILFDYAIELETSLDLLNRCCKEDATPTTRQAAVNKRSVIYSLVDESYLAQKDSQQMSVMSYMLHSQSITCDEYYTQLLDSN